MAASVQKKDLMIRLVTTTTLLKLGTKSQNVTMSKYRSHIEYPLYSHHNRDERLQDDKTLTNARKDCELS